MFLTVLFIANGSLLVKYYGFKQKNSLVEQINVVDDIDISEKNRVNKLLSDISDKYNFEIEIYRENGSIMYTTHGGQMMDFIAIGRENFNMQHERLIAVEKEYLEDGVIFETAHQRFGNKEFLLCTKEIDNGIYAEVRVPKELITTAASTANEFITIIAVICFVFSIIWVFWFSRRFARPITRMNDITKDISSLDFSRKVEVTGQDEIGQLAVSINEMSDSLFCALTELRAANEQLKGEIEAERKLDVMRRAFVANVSHELKTPLAIISGYAEGLKLNINSDAREEYCNTIIDESHRMNKLVLSILDLSRYESGQIPLNPGEINVGQLVTPMVQRIFAKSDVTALCEVAEDLYAFADPLHIEQALRAYLENALAHTPKGGYVKLVAGLNGKNIRISVFNSGSRVEEEQMPQIWQSFFRGDVSHKRDSGRFGLGLSIVSAICRAHGTSCGVYNTDDGVCFWLELPSKPHENINNS